MAKTLTLPLLCLFFFFTHPLVFSMDKNVIQLTDTNLAKKLNQNEHLLIMFFIPWSGLCHKLRPHFSRAADYLKDNNFPVALGKMDCFGLGRRTCDQKQLGRHFPIVHLYQNSTFIKEYTSSRDALSIIKFMRAQVLPAVLELKSVDEFKQFLKSQADVVVVGFFEENTKLKRRFFKVAEETKEKIIFAYTSCERVLFKEGVMNGIVLFRPENHHGGYVEDRVLFTGRDVIGEIKNFIISNYHGVVGHRTPSNVNHFENPLIVLYYTIDYDSDGKEYIYWRYRILKVAHKYRTYAKFVISAKDDFDEELADFPVDYTSLMRPFVLASDLEDQKFVMMDEFSMENFDKFVNDFLHGRLTPYKKSEIVSHDNNSRVVTVTSDNFEEMVTQNGKDTLLHLYASWSHRSKKIALVLREVADLLHQEDIAVVKMDIKENHVPEMFAKRNLPNLFWLPKHRKTSAIYEGERAVDKLIQFVAREATDKLKHYDRSGNPMHERDEL